MTSAFTDAFRSNTEASHKQMYHRTLVEALQVGMWGTDSQLFPLSLLMNRPIFRYNTFFVVSDTSGMTISVSNARDVADLARRFLAFDPDTRGHILYCSNFHRALLASGGINACITLYASVSIQCCKSTLGGYVAAVMYCNSASTHPAKKCILTD